MKTISQGTSGYPHTLGWR